MTLVGTGGVGKTRVALQAAADLLDGSGDGVWFVDLAPLSDPTLVASAIGATLGVREQPRASGARIAAAFLEAQASAL